jgi:hypothetical protein
LKEQDWYVDDNKIGALFMYIHNTAPTLPFDTDMLGEYRNMEKAFIFHVSVGKASQE